MIAMRNKNNYQYYVTGTNRILRTPNIHTYHSFSAFLLLFWKKFT